MKTFKLLLPVVLFSATLVHGQNSFAQTIPSSADPARILNEERSTIEFLPPDLPALEVEQSKTIDAPAGSKNLMFTLNSVTIDGLSVYEKSEFQNFFEDKIGQNIPASFIWELAARISQRYKQDGYFLSRAFVPAQKISTGDIRIGVIEGYVSDVEIEGKNKNDRLIKAIVDNIQKQKPLTIKHLESQLLRLGDLHGMKYDAILAKKKDGQDGTVLLKLKQNKADSGRLTLSANNYGSRFVGPYRAGIAYEDSIIDYQKTNISTLASLPRAEELALASVSHRIQVTPSVEVDFLLSKTKSKPGFTLKQNDIESNSFSWGFGAQWVPLRQREQNLKLFARLDSLNSNTDILNSSLTRDRVRAIRAGFQYDFIDRFLGFNVVRFTLSHGLSGFGASNKGDLNLSRADAAPDFTTLGISYNSQHFLTNTLLLNLALQGQYASKSLFSSEEFGYGGINIGRAYDFSEITGDHGIAALVELQYTNLPKIKSTQIIPFIFYDIGKVWNIGSASVKNISASSAGLGARFYSGKGINFDMAMAVPLTKSIDTPLYGRSKKSPIFRVGMTYQYDLK